MTDPFDEYGEILRRALHAEADSVMPSPDGLERIREGIGDRSHRRSSSGARGRLRQGAGWAWFSESWVRPLVAAGAAVLVVGLAVSAPPAIHGITSAGDRAPAVHGSPRHGSADDGRKDGRQNPPAPGASLPHRPTAVVTPTPTLSALPGTPSCPVTPPAVTPTPSAHRTPGVTPAPSVSPSPTCSEPPVTTTPTPTPSEPPDSPPVTPSVPPATDNPPQQPAP